jgi:hypothetical protein
VLAGLWLLLLLYCCMPAAAAVETCIGENAAGG